MAPTFFSNLRRRQLTKTVERHTREGRERDARRADARRRREWIVAAVAVAGENMTALEALRISAIEVKAELEALDREDIAANNKLVAYIKKFNGER
jgi:hypothetical protein